MAATKQKTRRKRRRIKAKRLRHLKLKEIHARARHFSKLTQFKL